MLWICHAQESSDVRFHDEVAVRIIAVRCPLSTQLVSVKATKANVPFSGHYNLIVACSQRQTPIELLCCTWRHCILVFPTPTPITYLGIGSLTILIRWRRKRSPAWTDRTRLPGSAKGYTRRHGGWEKRPENCGSRAKFTENKRARLCKVLIVSAVEASS